MIEKILIGCLLVSGWLAAGYLWCRLYSANDTIRLLRANAVATLAPDERGAMERAAVILNGGQPFRDDTPLAGDAATLRSLLERLR